MEFLKLSRSALYCCSASLLVLPGMVRAQAEPSKPAEQAEQNANPADIIVTAMRSAQRLQDVAMAVTVASGEQLQKFKIFDVKDVQQLAPGLELTNTTGRNNTTTLRGIGFDPDSGNSPAVQVYLNDIPTDAQTVYTAIYDINQIEVLRGPQGLLRGLSAPAGSITIATQRPDFNVTEGYAQATATDRHAYNVQAAVTLPFSDTFAVRVAGLVDGNRINNVSDVNRGGETSRSRTESARITLGWRPSSDFSAYLTYQYLAADNKQFQQVVGAGNTPTVSVFPYLFGAVVPNASPTSGPPLSVTDRGAVEEGVFRLQNSTHVLNLAADYDLGPATLSFIGAHQYTNLTITRDQDVGNAVPGYIESSNVVTPYLVDTAELRLTSNGKTGLGWGIGAFYTKQTGTTVVQQDQTTFLAPYNLSDPILPLVGGATIPLALRIVVPANTQTWSFNGNLHYTTGPLTLTGGVRYSIIKNIQSTDIYFNPLPAGVTANPLSDVASGLYHPVTGGATIDYALSHNLNLYATYGHSYRAGGHGVSTPALISGDLTQTNPEKTDSFEVGIKGSAMDRKINFTLTGYYQKLNNFLSRFTGIYYNVVRFGGLYQSSGFFDFNYNANATIKGVEGSLDLRPNRNIDLGASASYTKARFDNAKIPCNDYAGTGVSNQNGNPAVTGSGDVSYCVVNSRLAEVPDFSLTANGEIRFPTGDYTPFIRGLLTYRPGFFSNSVQYQYQDREMFNLFVGLRGPEGRWELDVFARNLLNQQRITNISGGDATMSTYCGAGYGINPALCNGKGTPYNSGYRTINSMNPREFGLTLSTKW